VGQFGSSKALKDIVGENIVFDWQSSGLGDDANVVLRMQVVTSYLDDLALVLVPILHNLGGDFTDFVDINCSDVGSYANND